MKVLSLISFLFLYSFSFSQFTQKMEGIWIAEKYHKDFQSLQSAVLCKKSFAPNGIAGLRINSLELESGVLNIGVGFLHDHMFHPEVSKYVVIEGDTIREQSSLEVDFNIADSAGFYNTDWYRTLIKFDDKSITIVRGADEFTKASVVKYVRIVSSFDVDYQYPNPIYFYTIRVMLEGRYVVKDSLGNVVEDDFIINKDGSIISETLFYNKKVIFSTDIYCGPPFKYDMIFFLDEVFSRDLDCEGFAFERKSETIFRLYKRKWVQRDGAEYYKLGNFYYEFIKQK